MRRLLKEPLLHFLLIGAAIFGLYGLANPGSSGDAGRRIVVSAGRIDQLAGAFARTWQRPPSPDELKGLVREYVLEEIYYRKALSMGIDQDDAVIRQHLREKMEFLDGDTAPVPEPTEEDLAAYLSANADRFRVEPAYTFRQIRFDPEIHGDDPEEHARRQLALANAGAEVPGDPSPLPDHFSDSSRTEVDRAFGTGFSARLDELTPGAWNGPIPSGVGLHLVRLESRTPEHVPELAAIRELVAREWMVEKQRATRKDRDDRLLGDYDVVVEWPDGAGTETPLAPAPS